MHVGLLTTLGCWQLDQFVLRRNVKIMPKLFVLRLSHVATRVMEYKAGEEECLPCLYGCKTEEGEDDENEVKNKVH